MRNGSFNDNEDRGEMMLSYILRRLLMLVPVLIGMTFITFSIVHLIPGNPAQVILGEAATMSAIESLEESMGLNKPYLVQYGIYMTDLDRKSTRLNSSHVAI